MKVIPTHHRDSSRIAELMGVSLRKRAGLQ